MAWRRSILLQMPQEEINPFISSVVLCCKFSRHTRWQLRRCLTIVSRCCAKIIGVLPVDLASTPITNNLRMPAGAQPNLSLILGGSGTTLEELVGAYRALARGGLAGRPRLNPDDPHVESRLMSAGAAWIVRDILEGGGNPDRPFH
jgi:penicillin-binding protein 1C